MAKKPTTPGKALGGGESCFREDGTYSKNACDALRLAAKKLAAATSKIQSITEDRDAWLKDFPTLKGKDRSDRAVQIVEAITSLKLHRAEKLKFGGTLGRIVAGLDAGQFNLEMSPKEIVDAAKDGGGRDDDEDEEGEGEGEKDADPKQLRLAPEGGAGPANGWHDQWKAYPAAFGDREWAIVYSHASKLQDLKAGNMVGVGSPHALTVYIARSFAMLKTTKDRSEIMPHAPSWFLDAIRNLTAEHVRLSLSGKGDTVSENAAADMLQNLTDAANKDVDAWLIIAGGKDSALNKAILRDGRKAV